MEIAQLKRLIKKVLENTGWNMLGLILPLLSAIVAIPILISHLGAERFGLLSLVWVLIGYFTLFDMGLGRAITKLVSEHEQQEAALTSLCETTLVLATAIGFLGGGLVLVVAWALLPFAEQMSAEFRSELSATIIWVALCIPMVVLTSVLKGILEGLHRFRVLNLIRGPAGALLFALPALVSIYSASLSWAVGMTLSVRALMLYAHYLPCRSLLTWHRDAFSTRWIRPLFEFGGWFTVSNLVGPVIVYMDRFILAAIMPFANLTYYTAPFELVSKVLNIPVALTAALFPTLNQIKATEPAAAKRLKTIAQWIVFLVMALIVIIGVSVSHAFIGLWLGADFVAQSTPVMQLLLIGFAFNALAQVTYVSLQSEGQTRIVAYLHLLELPLYGVLLWILIDSLGIAGAALAWTIRSVLDWVLLEVLLYSILRGRSIAGAKCQG